MEYYNMHYIRLDENSYIIKGFSDAFEIPLETDICINEQGGRHFELNGEINPPLKDLIGSHRYKYTGGTVLETSEEERTAENEQTQLPSWKETKITESKSKLEEYLASNPYLFTDGKYYSVTKDKQNLLANAISVYQMKVQAGEMNPVIKWNATGEQCNEWTISSITTLALSLAAYVEPLVAKQQEVEIHINFCVTKAELDEVVIDYATAI